MLAAEHVALADIIRRRSRKAHYMAASSPGRMGMIRGIASIAAAYADTLPNAQRAAFLAECGHAAATIRGEYDKSPSFINHNARASDPGQCPLVPAGMRCGAIGCDAPRTGARLFCEEHAAMHAARLVALASAADPAGKLERDASLEENPRHTWRDYSEVDGR